MSLASEVACCLIFEIPMLEVVSLESLEYASMMIGSHYSAAPAQLIHRQVFSSLQPRQLKAYFICLCTNISISIDYSKDTTKRIERPKYRGAELAKNASWTFSYGESQTSARAMTAFLQSLQILLQICIRLQ